MFEVNLIPRKFVQPDESKNSNSPPAQGVGPVGSVWCLVGLRVFFPLIFFCGGGGMGVKAFPRTAESPHFSRAEKGTHHSLVRGRSAGQERGASAHRGQPQLPPPDRARAAGRPDP